MSTSVTPPPPGTFLEHAVLLGLSSEHAFLLGLSLEHVGILGLSLSEELANIEINNALLTTNRDNNAFLTTSRGRRTSLRIILILNLII